MESIAQIGYLIASIVGLLFLVVLSSAWRGRFSGILLWLAVLFQCLWASSAMLWHWTEHFIWRFGYELADPLRYLFWMLLLFNLLDPIKEKQSALTRWLQHKMLWVAAISFLILSKFIPNISSAWFSLFGINLHLLLLMVLSLFCLILTEQLFRYTRKELLWAIKFLCFGMGLMFVYDFYLYSDALLFNRIRGDIEAARGYLALVYWPLIAVAVSRNPRWSVDLFVSRTLAVRSAVIVFAGVYLLLMALAGYYLKSTESQWGEAFLLVFSFSAGILLLLLLISGGFRSRVKFFVHKHFFASQFDYREEWIRFSRRLSEASKNDVKFLPEIIQSLAELVDSPGGMLWTKQNNNRFQYLAHWCMRPEDSELPIQSVAEYLDKSRWVIEISEYRENPERYSGLVIPEWILEKPLCWAIIPLILGEELIGVVILETPRVKRKMNWEDRDLLKTAAQQVAGYTKLHSATLDLVDARQFEAFNRLSAFVVHDLKNVCAQLSLITTNAKKHKANPAFVDDAFETVENSVQKINRMLSHLRKDRVEAVTTDIISLRPVLHNVIETRRIDSPVPSCDEIEESLMVRADADKLASVLIHLIQNAQEATPNDGRVDIHVSLESDDIVITLSDTGCGMSDEFVRTRLFKPFDTTKGNAGMGIGVYQSRETIESFGGSLSVKSKPGKGSTFTIRLAGAHSFNKGS